MTNVFDCSSSDASDSVSSDPFSDSASASSISSSSDTESPGPPSADRLSSVAASSLVSASSSPFPQSAMTRAIPPIVHNLNSLFIRNPPIEIKNIFQTYHYSIPQSIYSIFTRH